MNKWYEQAAKKLEDGRKAGRYDKYANVMKDAVCQALTEFCRQDEGFAQAVVQGGTFADCMKAVAKNCGSSLSDLEAYRRAVKFYLPEADVRFAMTVETGTGKTDVEPPRASKRKILDLTDLL